MIEIGKAYLFHTPLGIWAGRVAATDLDSVTLDECSWIADQGRMGECVRTGSYRECEYVGDGVGIPRGFISVPWRHPLPTADK